MYEHQPAILVTAELLGPACCVNSNLCLGISYWEVRVFVFLGVLIQNEGKKHAGELRVRVFDLYMSVIY